MAWHELQALSLLRRMLPAAGLCRCPADLTAAGRCYITPAVITPTEGLPSSQPSDRLHPQQRPPASCGQGSTCGSAKKLRGRGRASSAGWPGGRHLHRGTGSPGRAAAEAVSPAHPAMAQGGRPSIELHAVAADRSGRPEKLCHAQRTGTGLQCRHNFRASQLDTGQGTICQRCWSARAPIHNPAGCTFLPQSSASSWRLREGPRGFIDSESREGDAGQSWLDSLCWPSMPQRGTMA